MEDQNSYEKELEIKQLNIFFQKNGKEEMLSDRYNAGTYLVDKINKKLEALTKMFHTYQVIRNQVQMEAVENFKLKLKEDFVNTYYGTKKIIDAKMQEDFDRLQNVEKYGCFLINGVEVKLKNCADCKKRCPQHATFMKENFNFLDDDDEYTVKVPIKILTNEEEEQIIDDIIDETELEENDREEIVIEYKE